MNIGVSRTPSLDLSKAIKLKDMVFSCSESDARWITATVRTVTSNNLQRITVNLCPGPLTQTGVTVHREWEDLDCLLVRLWNTHSIRPKVRYEMRKGEYDMRDLALTCTGGKG